MDGRTQSLEQTVVFQAEMLRHTSSALVEAQNEAKSSRRMVEQANALVDDATQKLSAANAKIGELTSKLAEVGQAGTVGQVREWLTRYRPTAVPGGQLEAAFNGLAAILGGEQGQ